MDKTRVLTLIGQSFVQNESGQHIPAESRRDIFCRLTSISAAEFFAAGREGLPHIDPAEEEAAWKLEGRVEVMLER